MIFTIKIETKKEKILTDGKPHFIKKKLLFSLCLAKTLKISGWLLDAWY